MSLLNTARRYDTAPINFDEYISAVDAAPLLRVHADSLTRLCRCKLEYEGSALEARPPTGGQIQWWILRSYDRRLGKSVPISTEINPLQCTQRQRQDALARVTCVEEFNRALLNNTGRKEETWLPALIDRLGEKSPTLGISRSTLYHWRKAYGGNVSDLIDWRGGSRGVKTSPEIIEFIKQAYCHQNQPSITQVYKLAAIKAKEEGLQIASLRTVIARLDEWIPPQTQALYRKPVEYRTRLAPFVEQDLLAMPVGEWGIGDHRQFDVIVRDAGGTLLRPWMTAWIDGGSGRITGWIISPSPSQYTILCAFRHVVKDPVNRGGPSHIIIDNGKDFDCYSLNGRTKMMRRMKRSFKLEDQALNGAFAWMGVDVHHAGIEQPNGKYIEQAFRLFKPLEKTFRTYCGAEIADKPETLRAELDNPLAVPTFDEFVQRVDAHIAGLNARTDHNIDRLVIDGTRISPNEAMERLCSRTRIPADPKALDFFLEHHHKSVYVNRNGISLMIHGQTLHYGQFETALSRFKGVLVEDRIAVNVAYDPADLSEIQVFDQQWRYICTCSMNRMGGYRGRDPISQNLIKDFSRSKAQYARADKIVRSHKITDYLTPEEQLADLAAKQARPTPPPRTAETTMQIVQTVADGQFDAIERDKLRKTGTYDRQDGPKRFEYQSPSYSQLVARLDSEEAEEQPAAESTMSTWLKLGEAMNRKPEESHE